MQQVSSPRGFISGTGVITRKDGTKVPFEFKSEEPVSKEQVAAVFGEKAVAGMKTVVEGEKS